MHRLLRLFFCLGLCLPLLAPARADDAGKAAKVDQLVSLMWEGETIERLITAIASAKTSEAKIRAAATSIPEDKVRELEAKIRTEIETVIPRWKDALESIYASTFTEDEIDTLIAFHESSAGVKFRRNGTEIMNNAMLRFSESIRQPVQMLIEEFLMENQIKE